MEASSRGFATQLEFNLSKLYVSHGLASSRKQRMCFPPDRLTMLSQINCCYSNPVVPIRRASGSSKSNEKKVEDWRFDSQKSPHRGPSPGLSCNVVCFDSEERLRNQQQRLGDGSRLKH